MEIITIDNIEAEYTDEDLREPRLKTNQTYKFQVTKTEAKVSKAGNKMLVITLAPVTNNGRVLKQFSQRKFLTIPTATIKERSEKAYSLIRANYFNVVQNLAAPRFNAYARIEVTESGTFTYDEEGNILKGSNKVQAQENAKRAMMDARNAVLAGEIVEVGQEVYAALMPPRDDNGDWPELGYFNQALTGNEKAPFVDDLADMVG